MLAAERESRCGGADTRTGMLADEPLSNAIFSSVDLHVAILDSDGTIRDVNDAWNCFAANNGGTTALGVGANYLDVCQRAVPSCADAGKVLDGLLSVLRGAAANFQYTYRCDSPTEPRSYMMTVAPLRLPHQGVIVAHQNNTEMQQAAARYGELLDGVGAIVWRAEAPTFHTTFASKQTEQILGFPAADWFRQPELWQRRIHPDDRDRVLSYSSEALRERRNHSFEYRMIAADGRIVWLRNIVNVVVENDSVRELMGVSVDISERKAAEYERDQFARALLYAQEKERAAIARELHDDLGSTVTLLALKLTGLSQRLGPAADVSEDLRALDALTGKIVDDLGRISQGLHPRSLELVGLGAATRQLCAEIGKHQSIAVQCDVRDVPPSLDKEVAICLFRVAQEGLRNALKHSHAKTVSVVLSGEGSKVVLQISDDGVGFDPAAVKRLGGLGLAGMDERLRLVRGTFTVNSEPGTGARLQAVVPLTVAATSRLSAPECR